MAALIRTATGIEPSVVEGARGEFSIRVGDVVVARKDRNSFPSDEEAVTAAQAALGG